jgi:hypothetical protein
MKDGVTCRGIDGHSPGTLKRAVIVWCADGEVGLAVAVHVAEIRDGETKVVARLCALDGIDHVGRCPGEDHDKAEFVRSLSRHADGDIGEAVAVEIAQPHHAPAGEAVRIRHRPVKKRGACGGRGGRQRESDDDGAETTVAIHVCAFLVLAVACAFNPTHRSIPLHWVNCVGNHGGLREWLHERRLWACPCSGGCPTPARSAHPVRAQRLPRRRHRRGPRASDRIHHASSRQRVGLARSGGTCSRMHMTVACDENPATATEDYPCSWMEL